MEIRVALQILFLFCAFLFAVLGIAVITPIDQVVDAATSLSQDRIFKAIVLFLLTAIAVKA